MAPYGGLRGAKLSTAIGVVAGACFFLFGYDQGDLASILTIPQFRSQFPQLDTVGDPGSLHVATIQGVTVGAWNIGCFVSAMLTIFWGDVIGRKKTIFLGLAFLALGEIMQLSSFSLGQLIAGRVIAGFGNGFNTATIPAWQAECTKAHRRGTMLMISAGACITAGLSFSYWMAFAFSWISTSSAAWRAPIALQLILILAVAILHIFMPESPRWLILSGREDEALNVLSALIDQDRSAHETRQEYLQIKDAVLEMAAGGTADVFSMGDYRHLHRVVLAFMLQVLQQLTGINLITQYLALILINQFAYARWLAMLIAACAGTELFLASFVSVIGIDRFWGRRSLLLFGAGGMCLSMIVLAVSGYVGDGPSLVVGTVFLFAFMTFFAIGWQGMAWLYQVEIVPLRIRGPANAMSTAANWLINFVVVLIAPVAFHNIGYRTYIIFAVTNLIALPLVFFLYPETGFRCLEEVDVIFHQASTSGGNPWLNVRHIAAAEPLWYARNGDEAFDYEASAWHQRHLRFSDEIKDDEGESHTLKDGSRGSDSGSPSESTGERKAGSSENEKDEKRGWYGEDACPSPVISRVSVGRRVRSAGRGY